MVRITPDRFYGKTLIKKIKDNLGEEHEFKIKAISGKDMKLFVNMTNPNDPKAQAEAMWELLKKVFKDNVEDFKEEQLEEIDLGILMQIIDGIIEVNGLADEKDFELNKRIQEMKKSAGFT